MRRTATVLGLLLLAVGLVAPPAQAQFFQCFEPDDDEPVIFDFEIKPSFFPLLSDDPFDTTDYLFNHPPTEVGTLVRAKAWDIPNRDFENQHNGVVRVLLVVDGQTHFEMQPEDGTFGGVRDTYRVVLPPQAMFPGVHTISITANDACGNTTTRLYPVYQYTFLASGTCADEPLLC